MYTATSLVSGFPGMSHSHGAFGWSSLWLLADADRRILVDTGPPAYVPLILERLAEISLSCDDITDVILTHLHWDHIGNVTMFPKAVIWCGETELTWALAQPACTPFLSDLHVQHIAGSGARALTSDHTFIPGITAVSTPGHTPGHLSFRVEGRDAVVIFAGDSVKNARELSTLTVDSTLDVTASTASITALRGLMLDERATLIPGHDLPLDLVDDRVVRRGVARADFSVVTAPAGPVRRFLVSTDPSEGAAAQWPEQS